MLVINKTDRVLNFSGYGIKLVPGENQLTCKVPYGLFKSLWRHEQAGQLRIVREDAAPETVAAQPASQTPPSLQFTGKRHKRRRR